MPLIELQIEAVRNLHGVRMEALAPVNVFFGPNGSGKTTVLESIHILGMARSFRGNSMKSVISHAHEACTIFGLRRDAGSGAATTTLGVQRNRVGEARIKVGGEAVRTVAELAEQLPLQVINIDSFGLLTGSPSARRQFLDWGVFHVEQSFLGHWQRFQRCIKQRNNALRRDKLTDRELAVWTKDLAAAGEAINTSRQQYFKALAPRFRAIMGRLAPSLEALEIHYRQGWDKQLSYAEALRNSEASDREHGYTHTGPQRADMRVTVNGHSAADTLSRGQQKLVVCGLKLAQGQMMSELEKGACTYLIDDLPAELDQDHSKLVCELLAAMDAQVFITCVDRGEVESVWPADCPLALFHVEQGAVRRAA